MIELTNCQLAAASKIKNWFYENKEQIFTLSGYAGTGKTFLVKHVVFNILNLDESDVGFVAPTGKAASVMIQRGLTNAGTIHRMIYHAVENETETEVDGKKITSKRISFVKKEKLDYRYKLIVVDEVSMVEQDILEDLVSFGVPLLCCGDRGAITSLLQIK